MKFVLLALAAIVPAMAQTYTIDTAHSSAQFSVKHLMVSNVRGEFTKMTGSVNWDDANPAKTSIDATIDVAGASASGTITNDDETLVLPSLAITALDAAKPEGDSGTTVTNSEGDQVVVPKKADFGTVSSGGLY